MVEPIDIKEIPTGRSSEYSELISAIDKNPYDPETWERVLNLAKNEEGTEKAQMGFYGHMPLGEMIKTADRLRKTESLDDKYKILAEKSSTEELWYDIVLGRTNDKSLTVMEEYIGKRRWEKGLDIGSGTGNSLLEIKKHAESFVGLDRLGFLLQVAGSRPELAEARLVTGEALNLPFSDGAFDLVMSNGLTYYLSKGELPKFVSEVVRVLEQGGSYFETFAIKEEHEVLPFVEKEFLRSGKSVLACLMDRLITHREKEVEVELSHYLILKSAFEKQGIACSVAPYWNEGILVLEFEKRLPREFEYLKRTYLSGDTHASYEEALILLYGEHVFPSDSGKKAIKEGKLPSPEKIISSIHFFEKLAAQQKVIEANPPGNYFLNFIRPLVDLATSKSVDSQIKELTIEVLGRNLENIYRGRVKGGNPNHWEVRGFYKRLNELLKELKDKVGCEQVVSQITDIIQEKK